MRNLERQYMVRKAISKAYSLRQSAGINYIESVNPFDIALRNGMTVRLVDLPSMEGMFYDGDLPLIVVSSLRPYGRQYFTGAHELGHGIFGHGTQLDELVEAKTRKGSDLNEELLADSFAGFLMMPKTTVLSGFRSRGFDPKSLNPLQYYTVAAWLGVGYQTLIYQCELSLNVLSSDQAIILRKESPKTLRSKIYGDELTSDLFIYDENWIGRPIDMQIGDVLLTPLPLSEEYSYLEFEGVKKNQLSYRAMSRGIEYISLKGRNFYTQVRIRPREYVGLWSYAFLADDKNN